MDVEQARFSAAAQAVPGAPTVTNGAPTADLLQSQTVALPPPDAGTGASPEGPSPVSLDTGGRGGAPDAGQDAGGAPKMKFKLPRWLVGVIALGSALLILYLLYRLVFRTCPAPKITVRPQIEVDVPSCACTTGGGGSKSPSPSRRASSSPGCAFPGDKTRPSSSPGAPVVGVAKSPVPASPAPVAAVASDGISPRREAERENPQPRDVRSGTGVTYTTGNQGAMRTSFAQDMVAPYAGPTAFGQFAAGAL